jgi:hypothetical protein
MHIANFVLYFLGYLSIICEHRSFFIVNGVRGEGYEKFPSSKRLSNGGKPRWSLLFIPRKKGRKALSKNKIVTSPWDSVALSGEIWAVFALRGGPWEGQFHLSPTMEIFRFWRETISPSQLLSFSSPLTWIRIYVWNLTDSSFLLHSLWRWMQYP